MVRQATLARKIGLGFLIIMCLTVIVGMAGYFALQKVVNGTDLLRKIDSIQRYFASAKARSNEYMLNNYEEGRDRQTKAGKAVLNLLDQTVRTIDRANNHGAASEEFKKKLLQAKKEINAYKTAFNKYTKAEVEKIGLTSEIKQVYGKQSDVIKEAAFKIEELLAKSGVAAAASLVYLDRNTVERWKKVQSAMTDQQTTIDAWYEKMQGFGKLGAKGDHLKENASAARSLLDAYHTEVAIQTKSQSGIKNHKKNLNMLFGSLGDITIEKSQDVEQYSTSIILGFILASLLMGIFYSIFSTRSIVNSIQRIIKMLTDGANQVVSASEQVSSSSTQLAEGSARQAASIQQTSASLEEMSSMTKQNADNATQSNTLMEKTVDVVGGASKSMSELVNAMEEVSKSNEETQKIVKTIDEIAFQTNLLALNAAVEAARAGEAGAGFAVVAEEVRNLAIRSADAAKNTTLLIEDTVNKVKGSSKVVTVTNEAFSVVSEETAKISHLIAEISAASQEQSRGIDQINQAVLEIDKVTLQSASSAEESASASEEMNAQAEQMKNVVGELAVLIGGRNNKKRKAKQDESRAGTETNWAPTETPRTVHDNKATVHITLKKPQERTPDQVIPLDDDDFKDF